MLNETGTIKGNLTEDISQLCEVSWMFVKDRERDFTKKKSCHLIKSFRFFWQWKVAAFNPCNEYF